MTQVKTNKRVLLIPFDKLDELEMEIKTLKETPLDVKKQMAIADLSLLEFVDLVNLSADFRAYDLDTVHCDMYDENEDRVDVDMNMEDDTVDVRINNKWELHLTANEGNLSVDAYHVFDGEDEDLEHDYDEDFITGLGWLSADDLERDEDND